MQLVVVSAVRAAVAAAITMRSSASQRLRFMILKEWLEVAALGGVLQPLESARVGLLDFS